MVIIGQMVFPNYLRKRICEFMEEETGQYNIADAQARKKLRLAYAF